MGAPRLMVFCIILIAMTGLFQPIGWSEGLKAEIINVGINNELKPVITFKIMDDMDRPLSLDDVSIRGFILARLEVVNAEKGSMHYFSYTTRTQTVPEGEPNAGASAEQVSYDSGGNFNEIELGHYQYVFGTALPADFDRTATHSASAQIARTIGEDEYFANPLFHFVPDGSEVTTLRKVVTTEACNQCHTRMGFHGGGRREIGLCVLCHTPQTVDPDTGNTVDMRVIIHKIHRGTNLPSVEAGGSYKIVGYRQSVHDYSHVEFPMDIRNCTICHAGENGEVYKNAPSRLVCGACHDGVNFETGEGHGPGIPQTSDETCTQCHISEGPEFGISIAGAHTVPFKSEQLPGLNAEILAVENAAPNQAPIVRYRVTNGDGSMVDLADMSTVAITFGGPTKEYTRFTREDAGENSTLENDAFVYTFTAPIPADAEGTYAFAIEARRNVNIVIPGEEEIEVTEAADNPIFKVAITGDSVNQRRQIVNLNRCNVCHDKLSLHGSLRNQIDYCVVCHNPKVDDIRRRPEGVQGGESVSFSYMIHKIHTGEELHQDYTVYGYGNRPHDYNEVLFPGKRKECSICHVEEVPALPLSEVVEPIDFFDKEMNLVHIPPTTAACTSCHDMREVIAHAQLNTTSDGIESCAVCHREGRDASIIMAHDQDEFLNVIEHIGAPPTSVDTWTLFEQAQKMK